MALTWSDLAGYGFFAIKAITYTAIAGSVGVLTAIYFFQKTMIYASYVPEGSRQIVAKPEEVHLHNWENVTIKTPDGVNITGYLIKHGSAITKQPYDIHGFSDPTSEVRQRSSAATGNDSEVLSDCTLLFLHANAGNMGHRLPIAKALYDRLKCNIFMLSYRGYGLSEGVADERGLKIDAQAALDFITNHNKLKHTKIIVYGQSIGGAVAINLASKNSHRISALIVENTFMSMRKLIPSVIKFLKPFAFLCHQIWDSESDIIKVENIPVLLLSGRRDELIPPVHMDTLKDKLVAERLKTSEKAASLVEFVEFPNGRHNDTVIQPGYFDAITVFWNRHK